MQSYIRSVDALTRNVRRLLLNPGYLRCAWHPNTTASLRSVAFLLLVLTTVLLSAPVSPATSVDPTLSRTLDILREVEGITSEDVTTLTPRISSLSYTQKRVLRTLCQLPDSSPASLENYFTLLAETKISFTRLPLLEYFVTLPDADLPGYQHLLSELTRHTFASDQILVALAAVPMAQSGEFFNLLEMTATLNEAGQWAAKSLFELDDINVSSLSACLYLMRVMSEPQLWAVGTLLDLDGLPALSVYSAMVQLSRVGEGDARTLRALFIDPSMTPETLSKWLNGYFSTSPAGHDIYYTTLSEDDKNVLLATFNRAADTFIWQINNLHDITDPFGREIGSSRLASLSYNELQRLFSLLQPEARQLYGRAMKKAVSENRRQAAIATLRSATARSRVQTAKNLSSANLYILLANGSELYDSSFRDVLVPVLKRRIEEQHDDHLLEFLEETDPQANYVSDFITNIAHKGKLTTFFPEDGQRQKEILARVAESALHNESSLILFSATFTRLLLALKPVARTFLLKRLLVAVKDNSTGFSRQVQVILQHYLDNHSDLLSIKDRMRIESMLARRSRIDISRYITTPFQQWLNDNRLTSLSVFHNDDDGHSSYISYCRNLLKHGYRPQLSTIYQPAPVSDTLTSQINSLITGFKRAPSRNLSTLFHLSAGYPLAIDWIKKVKTVYITHTVHVFQDSASQQEMLATFLSSDHEMFAQRGHSYWRREQLFEPLEAVLKERLSDDILSTKKRFISIGSCGGIRAYSKINRMFDNNVDILATVGTGKATINNPYNRNFFELIARGKQDLSWQDIADKTSSIFSGNLGDEYIQPGSLPAILHKMIDTRQAEHDTF